MRKSILPLHVFRSCASKARPPERCPDAATYRRVAGRSTGTGAVLLFLGVALLIAPVPGFAGAIGWDGGSGDWFGTWLGSLPGNPAPFPTPTTNWGCEFCYPGTGDTANIGTLFGSPIGAVTGTAQLLNSTATVAGVALGNGAFGGLQVLSGGNLTL